MLVLATSIQIVAKLFLLKRPSRSLLRKFFRFGSFRLHVCKLLTPKGSDLGVDLAPIWTLGSIAIRGSAGAEKAKKTNGFSILFIKTYEKP